MHIYIYIYIYTYHISQYPSHIPERLRLLHLHGNALATLRGLDAAGGPGGHGGHGGHPIYKWMRTEGTLMT